MEKDAEVSVQPLKMLSDDVDLKPILGLDRYAETIVRIVKGSDPKLSLGIYGEWGSGKTTLMRLIESKLSKNEHILCVWFNAWRYEREEQFAIIALLKTIGYAMGEHEIYKGMKPLLLNAVKLFAKGFFSEIASRVIGEKGVDEFKDKILPKMDLLMELDKDTIYFDGIYKIEKEIGKILKEFPNSRVVVFIDDLDRCSPKKALEVFESVKVFLDIKGFIFLIGLSHETVSKLISAEYKESGVKGEQYIKKIIQIPVLLPEWTHLDVETLIDNLLEKNEVDKNYVPILTEHKLAIAAAIERSPRELKRFINNFILAYEIYSAEPSIKADELLIVQSLKLRWNSFYLRISSDELFRRGIYQLFRDLERFKQHWGFSEKEPPPNLVGIEERIKTVENLLSKEKRILNIPIVGGRYRGFRNEKRELEELRVLSTRYERLIKGIDDDLLLFLTVNGKILDGINNWDIYRKVVESENELLKSASEKKSSASDTNEKSDV